MEDKLPSAEEVRVDEFINRFETGYESGSDKVEVLIDAAPSPFSSDDRVLMRVVIQAPDKQIPLPDTILVLADKSGSMNGLASDEFSSYGTESLTKFELLMEAVDNLAGFLPSNVKLGYLVESVSGQDKELVHINSAGDSQDLDRFLESFKADNTPRGNDKAIGLSDGVKFAQSEAGAGNSVLLLVFADGISHLREFDYDNDETVGNNLVLSKLQDIKDSSNIALAVVGLSVNQPSNDLLRHAAGFADGTYHYINLTEQVEILFSEHPHRLLDVAARDVSFHVDFLPGAVASHRLLGFHKDAVEVCEDGTEAFFTLDRLNSGESYTMLYELELANNNYSNLESVADVALEYEAPHGESTSVGDSISGGQIAEEFSAANPNFRVVSVAANFGELLRDSARADASDWKILMEEASSIAAEFPIDWDAAELNPSDFVIPEIEGLVRSAAFLTSSVRDAPAG